MLEVLSNALPHLAAAKTTQELRDRLSRDVEAIGFFSYNISLDKRYPAEFMEHPTLTNWTEEQLQTYLRGYWAGRDPLLKMATEAEHPFLWNAEDWLETEHAVYARYVLDQGIVGGATVPMKHNPDRLSAMTLLACDPASLTRDALQAAGVLAHIVMARLIVLSETTLTEDDSLQRLRLLSNIQLEILSWVAQGKTNAEIGIILGRNRRTIDYHMQEIISKLQVTSRAQAAAVLAAS